MHVNVIFGSNVSDVKTGGNGVMGREVGTHYECLTAWKKIIYSSRDIADKKIIKNDWLRIRQKLRDNRKPS